MKQLNNEIHSYKNTKIDTKLLNQWLSEAAILLREQDFQEEDLKNFILNLRNLILSKPQIQLVLSSKAFENWVDATLECLQNFDNKQAATSLHSLAHMVSKGGISACNNEKLREFLSGWVETCNPYFNEFNSQDIANTLWAMARLDYRDEAAIKSLLSAAKGELREFNSQELANTIWAMAKLDYKDEAAIKSLLNSAKGEFREFNSQDIANTLWSMAKLDYKDDVVIKALLNAGKDKFREFNSQEIANTLWAMATLGMRDDAAIKDLLNTAKGKFREFNSQDIANTLWAMAKLDYRDEAAIESLLNAGKDKFREFNSQEISNTIWAVAKLDYRDEAAIKSLLNAGKDKFREFNSQDIANTLWAMAAISAKNDIVFEDDLIQKILNHAKLSQKDFSLEQKYQIFQACKYFKIKNLLISDSINLLESGLFSSQDFEFYRNEGVIVSESQKRVFALMKAAFSHWSFEMEYWSDEILTHIDIYGHYNRKCLFIQVDGPNHYFINTQGKKEYKAETVLNTFLIENYELKKDEKIECKLLRIDVVDLFKKLELGLKEKEICQELLQ